MGFFFVPNPLKYMQGGLKVLNNIRFEDMPIGELFEVVRWLVLNPPTSLYYSLPRTTLSRGIRPLKTDKDMEAFMKVGFENGFKVDLYTEFNDYDVMEYVNNDNLCENDETSDGLDYVSDERKGNFIGTRDNPIPPLSGKYILEENDPDDHLIDAKYMIKKGVKYPSYNPETPWDEFKPILGMKFKSPLYRDVEFGRCAGRRGLKKKKKDAVEGDNVKGKKVADESDKVKGKKVADESDNVKGKKVADESDKVKGKKVAVESGKKPKVKWTRMRVQEHKGKHYPFRLWASWMSGERLWELSGIPCVHDVAGYFHFKLNPDDGVSSWYTQAKWFDTYQFSIKPVYGSKIWRSTINTPPLPPIVKTMLGRPRKCRIKHPSEKDDEHHVSRVGKVMTCQNCWRTGHNKASCTNPKTDKPKDTNPPRSPKYVYTKSLKRKSGITINDVCKSQKQVGETSKRGGGSASRGRGSASRGRGSASRGRGSASMGRGSASKRGISASKGVGCASKECDGTSIHERCGSRKRSNGRSQARRGRRKSEWEQNGRIYQDWDDLRWDDTFSENLTDRRATLSELAALDEAIDEHNATLPSISEGVQAVSVDISQPEHQILQPEPIPPHLVQAPTEQSQTERAPRRRTQVRPRPKSKRIAKRRNWGWKNILSIRDKIKNFVISKIGDGTKTSMWNLYEARLLDNLTVSDMVSNGKWKWPRGWNEMFPVITNLPDPLLDPIKSDKMVWKLQSGSEIPFSIKHISEDLRDKEPVTILGRLSTQDKLGVWGINAPNMCLLCYQGLENHDHLFFGCAYSSKERNYRMFRDESKRWEVTAKRVLEIVKTRLLGLKISGEWSVVVSVMY
ncbi:hypothetical protein CTI12_AA460550 [Artemisia annua]|uniref:Reverse transcriptase zinc-binding domain-containing protein n=1 Tax=Artemisia annua TaxID=35608 RepID=A0A2U1LRR5_ARTAN|nr:hypothetical protein CTI12_AA460550 [Artemisia annua]